MILEFLNKLKTFAAKGSLLLLPLLLLFSYILLRAKLLALTWDEANTFFEYVRNPRWLPQDFNYMSANNHLLNTWLMKCSVSCFGESELALRLPNVLAGAVYLFMAAAIAMRLFEKRGQALLAFLIITCNPFVIDFFSVARGYGISLALLLCAFYQLMKYVLDDASLKRGMYAQAFLVAATLANLTIVYLLPAISFLLLLDIFLLHRPLRLKRAVFLLTIIPVLAIALLLPYEQKLSQAGALFFGQEIKSAGETFLSLAQASLYKGKNAPLAVLLLTIFFSAVPLVSALYCMRNSVRMLRSTQGRWIVFATLILFFAITGPVLQHWIFKSNFLYGRTALFYLPLIALNLLGLLSIAHKNIKNGLLLVFGILAAAHLLLSLNTDSFYEWREQAQVKEAMSALKKNNILLSDNIYANIMSSGMPFEKQINYYRMRFHLDKISHAGRNEDVPACSMYYSLPDRTSQVKRLYDSRNSDPELFYYVHRAPLKYVSEVWQDFEHEDPYLELKTDTLFFGDRGTFAGNGHPYSISVGIAVPDSVKSPLVVTLNCRLYYYTRNTSALLVLGFDDGNAENWEAMHITELPERPHEWSITGWTRPVPPGTKKVRAYLWNRDESPVLMDNVSLRLLTYPR